MVHIDLKEIRHNAAYYSREAGATALRLSRVLAIMAARDAAALLRFCHSIDPYRYVNGALAIALAMGAVSLKDGKLPSTAKLSLLTGSLACSLLATRQFKDAAKRQEWLELEENEALDQRRFALAARRERFEQMRTIEVDAEIARAQHELFGTLPLEYHPDADRLIRLRKHGGGASEIVNALLGGINSVLEGDVLGDASDPKQIAAGGQNPGAGDILDQIPIEDLAEKMATTQISILIAAMTRTGKTVLIRNAMIAFNKLHDNAQFWLFNGKNGTRSEPVSFCGFEKSDCYQLITDVDHVPIYVGTMNAIRGDINDADYEVPTRAIFDEYNNIRDALQDYDEQKETSYLKKNDSTAKRIITQGAFKNFGGWFAAHSPIGEDIGLNGAIAKNMAYIALGRGPEFWSSIERILDPKFKPMPEADRKRLILLFNEYRDQYGHREDQVIAVTNLFKGRWMLVRVAQYNQFPGDIEYQENSATEQTKQAERKFDRSQLPEKGIDFLKRALEIAEETDSRVFKIRFLYKRWGDYNLKGTQFEVGLNNERTNGFRSFLVAINAAGGGKFVFPDPVDPDNTKVEHWEITASLDELV